MSCYMAPNIMHTKGENTRSFIVYTVWDNRTDKCVIVDGEARDCAKAMGLKMSSFYSTVTKVKNGIVGKWTIMARYCDGGCRRTWENVTKGGDE